MIKQKKAQGHVEMMMSFALFIGALIFIFIFINPFAKTGGKIYSIDQVKKIIIEEISDDIGIMSIILSSTLGEDDPRERCNTGELNIIISSQGMNYIIIQDFPDTNLRKYTVYYNEFLNPNFFPSSDLTERECKNGAYYEDTMVVEQKIKDLKTKYQNYQELKKSLKITHDFLFKIKTKSGQEISGLSVSKIPPTGVNIESKDYTIRVIDNQGEIKELVLNIRVW